MKKMNKCIARQVAKQGKHSIKLFYSNLSSAAPCCSSLRLQSSFEDTMMLREANTNFDQQRLAREAREGTERG